MNQIDTGKFIANCRKEKGMTQAQLAERLNITDRAVSKWETGKCMPDSSIMLELCKILDVSVNELLCGERIEMNNYEEKVNENLIELKKKEENHISKNALIAFIFSATMISGLIICCICDLAITGKLTWSLITLSSILFTWIIAFPVILLGKKGVIGALLAFSILVIPFMYILSVIIKSSMIFSIGAVMSVVAIVLGWIIYLVYRKFSDRFLFATGITCLIAIPATLVINVIISKLVNTVAIDIWDILTDFGLLILAVALFVADYARRKGFVK